MSCEEIETMSIASMRSGDLVYAVDSHQPASFSLPIFKEYWDFI